MTTIKLVVIGASGVGKTSLRGKYISGRFSNGYRATIGADFITKTLPHPIHEDQSVMLQIWDTAGQERFSSLSSAFFRGADAALLMFDASEPQTLEVLTKWWAEFKDRAPLADEDMEDYCCVVVGNKTDLITSENEGVTEFEARRFLEQLVPPSSGSSSPLLELPPELEEPEFSDDDDDYDPLASSELTARPPSPRDHSDSIAIIKPHASRLSPSSHSPKHRLSKSRSRSSSRYYSGTMTSTHTTLSIYHTPSSSIFDSFQSARTSPEPWSTSSVTESSPPTSITRPRRLTTTSHRTTSSGSAITMTPSLFAREQQGQTAATTPEGDIDARVGAHAIAVPDRGPKLFFTSAKTGDGVEDVFEYIAKRVVGRWEYEERVEARRMHMREASAADTIQLGNGHSGGGKMGRAVGKCC